MVSVKKMQPLISLMAFALLLVGLGIRDIQNQHQTLAEYTLSVIRWCGKDTTNIYGILIEGYEDVEFGFLRAGFFIGLGIGLILVSIAFSLKNWRST